MFRNVTFVALDPRLRRDTHDAQGRRDSDTARDHLWYRFLMTGFDKRLFLGLLLLAGCNPTPDPAVLANVEAEQRTAANDAGRIECASDGAAAFAADCTIERTADGDDTILTLRQPNGGFHRLRITRDGRGVVAADGSEAAKVTVIGDSRIEVAIGGARYRLPATVGPVAR